MVHDLIASKIESLQRCLDRIVLKRPASLADFENDIDVQDIVVLNLERAIQLSVDMAMVILSEENAPVPATMAEAFEELARRNIISEDLSVRMKKATGFRNLVVHAYHTIDWAIVWSIINDRLDEFRQFSKAVYTWK